MKSLLVSFLLAASLPAQALPPIALQGLLSANSPCLPLRADWAPQSGSLVNVWHLDDTNGTLSAADSISGNTALASSGAGSISEHIGRASWMNVPYGTGLVTSNLIPDPTAFTYTVWVKTSSFAGGGIIGFADTQTSSVGDWDRILAMTSTGQFVFGFWNGSAQVITSPSTYNNGSWHHVAVTYSNGTSKLYVDGSMVATLTAAAALPYAGYFRIATAYVSSWPGFPTQDSFDGLIDEVGLWSTVLTAGEIATLAASPSEVNSSHPRWANTYGIYHFSEASGNFLDSTPNGNTAVTYNYRPTTVAGFYGTAANGVSGSVVSYTTSTQYNNPQVFTFMSWFKTTSTVGGVIIEFGGQQTGYLNNYDRFIAMEDSGRLVFGVNGGVSVARSPLAYNDGKWHHVAATFTPGTQIVYVDGLQVATAAGPDAEANFGWWRIGNGNLTGWSVSASSTLYYGYLDEVAVWFAELTPADVVKVYRNQRCGSN